MNPHPTTILLKAYADRISDFTRELIKEGWPVEVNVDSLGNGKVKVKIEVELGMEEIPPSSIQNLEKG